MLSQNLSIFGIMEREWKSFVEISPTCPRCGSSNTKFCYYNNYSLAQPRYFCKGCRRYWTRGGSLRNVPVGGGCRKSRRGKLLHSSPDGGLRSSRSLSVGTSLGHDGGIIPRLSESSRSSDGSSIDLSSIYANFLNNKSEPMAEPQVEFPQFPNAVGPSFEFTRVLENENMEYYLSAHLSQENGLVESRRLSISDPSLNARFVDENGHYFCGFDSIEEQHELDHSFMGMNHAIDYVMPPLPEADGVSDGMVWPSSDGIAPKAQDPSHMNDHESLFDVSTFDIFYDPEK